MEQITTLKSNGVRVGHDLIEAEKQHVTTRKETIIKSLQQHNMSCSLEDIPNIAVLGSGGGERAMVGLLGALNQLGQEGLLDSIMYLSGVSGSTWCMASLYKEKDWSTKMETVTDNIIKRLGTGQVTATEQMQKLVKYSKMENFSLTDIWAAVFVSNVVKEIDENTLTEQRGQHTKDPYPIYNVIDKHCLHDKIYKDTLFEITPDESGYSLTGAYIDTECFGSLFKNGMLNKKLPEMDMLYLQGLCGSALADMKEIKSYIYEELHNWLKGLCGGLKTVSGPGTEMQGLKTVSSQEIEMDKSCQVLMELLELNLCVLRDENPTNSLESLKFLLKEPSLEKCEHEVKMLSKPLRHWTTGEEISVEELKKSEEEVKEFTLDVCEDLQSFVCKSEDLQPFLCKSEDLQPFVLSKQPSRWDTVAAIIKSIKKAVTWKWGTAHNYLQSMSVPDVDSSVLTAETRDFMDAGLLINSPYFSVLRKERDVDLIISLDFSAGNPFETVVQTAKRCKDLNIPFPKVDLPNVLPKEPQDYYVFKSDDGKAPRVIHIPLFNAVNCKGEVTKWEETYSTFQGPYSPEKISDLLKKSALNIKNNKEKLLKDIREVNVEKKKKKQA